MKFMLTFISSVVSLLAMMGSCNCFNLAFWTWLTWHKKPFSNWVSRDFWYCYSCSKPIFLIGLFECSLNNVESYLIMLSNINPWGLKNCVKCIFILIKCLHTVHNFMLWQELGRMWEVLFYFLSKLSGKMVPQLKTYFTGHTKVYVILTAVRCLSLLLRLQMNATKCAGDL